MEKIQRKGNLGEGFLSFAAADCVPPDARSAWHADSLPAPLPRLLSLEQVAAYTMVPLAAVRALVRSGDLPSTRSHGMLKVHREALWRFMDRRLPR